MTDIQHTLKDLEESFESAKATAGNPAYIACFGKTFLDPDSEAYALSQKVGEVVIESGFGVVHGGYTGAMQAVSLGANVAIAKDPHKNTSWNIGVPMRLFDGNVARSSSIHVPPAKDIADRKTALISFSDACIVLPQGGVGTFLETLEILHMNQIAEKFGGKVRPIFFLGGNWKSLFTEMFTLLDMHQQSKSDAHLFFLVSLDELRTHLIAFKHTYEK